MGGGSGDRGDDLRDGTHRSHESSKSHGHQLTTAEYATLKTKTFFGKEKKSLAYVIAIMNMILHGIEAPNIIHSNTFAEHLADVQEKDRFHIIVANPPFGGKERKEVQQNFPIRTGETAFINKVFASFQNYLYAEKVA